MGENLVGQDFRERENEIGIIELWRILWGQRNIILCTVGFFAVASVIYSLLLTDIFRADVLLSPMNESSTLQVPGQLGIATNLLGARFTNSDSNTTNALATISSREFIREFISKHDLMPWLFASNYDSAGGRSSIDTTLYSIETSTWVSEQQQYEPTDAEAYIVFREILSVLVDQNTSLITISIEWPDPQLAARWLNWLVDDINEHIKLGDMLEAQLAIDYLTKQLESTQLVDLQRVFYQLIESETRTLMLADIRKGYVFETIDPAVIPEESSKPNRALICIFGTLLGGVLSVLYVLVKHNIVQDTSGKLNREN